MLICDRLRLRQRRRRSLLWKISCNPRFRRNLIGCGRVGLAHSSPQNPVQWLKHNDRLRGRSFTKHTTYIVGTRTGFRTSLSTSLNRLRPTLTHRNAIRRSTQSDCLSKCSNHRDPNSVIIYVATADQFELFVAGRDFQSRSSSSYDSKQELTQVRAYEIGISQSTRTKTGTEIDIHSLCSLKVTNGVSTRPFSCATRAASIVPELGDSVKPWVYGPFAASLYRFG